MLYEAWCETARQNPDGLALVEMNSRRRWTFSQLAEEAETGPAGRDIVFPQGVSAKFIFDVLRAWRSKSVVCPLEIGQVPPTFAALPVDCAHLKATSGSTGVPQWISFKPAQLQADAAHIVAAMGLRSDWPNLGVISLAHSYGFSNLILPLLLHGVPLILGASPLPQTVRQTCEEFNHITLPAVPALWRAWQEGGAITDAIKLAISAGAPLPSGLEWAIFQKHQLKVHNFYGASECGGIAYDGTSEPRELDDAVGAPMPGVTLELNGDGCLRVHSGAVGETYWPTPDGTLSQGCFQSTDRAEIENGQIFLRGRHTDVINIAGRKVAPEAIERALLQHPSVLECVVFAVPDQDPLRSDAIVACISAKENLPVETLKHFLQQSLAAWQLPRHWWFQSNLVEPTRGKTSRAKWRERFLEKSRKEPIS